MSTLEDEKFSFETSDLLESIIDQRTSALNEAAQLKAVVVRLAKEKKDLKEENERLNRLVESMKSEHHDGEEE